MTTPFSFRQGFSRPGLWAVFFGLGLTILGLDLWTKELAFDALGLELAYLEDGRPFLEHESGEINPARWPRIPVIADYFELEGSLNDGAFSGWFSGHTFALALLSLTALFVIAGFLFFSMTRGGRPNIAFVVALGLLWGGTGGNFYDRYFIGAVRDFIKWFVVIDDKQHVWPNFNIADSGICVGVSIILILEVMKIRAESRPAK